MFNRQLEAYRWFHSFRPLAEHLRPEDPESLNGDEILLALGHLEEPNESHLLFYCSTELEETTLHKKLLDAKVILPKHTSYKMGYLSTGFVLADINTIIVPFTELTRRYKIRRQKQRSTYHTVPSEVYELNPGDMVVHMNNGIGRYLGLEKRPNNQGVMSEFFAIEYAENAKLYVPMSQAHLVSKYIGATEAAPKMHTLGSSRWKKAKESTQKALVGYAKDLLTLYAQRELHGGFSYSPDGEDMKLFEEDFPFVETEDQLNAIDLVKNDMKSPKAMDRLICGDVGYGKTEVAMRAAFKAVVDGGKQVAVLVPTTVLAMQHFENFQERMRHFPVRVGVLSRFQTAKQVRETLAGVANGSVDILVGTHRIISGDVQFKDLGLIIIDEEQRFGVKAKEHLKKLKVGVDCLTLSATPIPRTLYLSLIGARDMSVINTPPQDRLPIKTILTEPTDQIIKNAVLRELSRDGQVYFIHNRVETIYEAANRIKKLVPQARIVVGHGQMHSDDIDDVFHAFKRGDANVLVATTIVENGIDIPNANTILIDRADHFGLADLYQLRGRTGRWNRRAYAYFLVSRLTSMPEISRQRLNALAATTGYGGGMKVAMRDLELRGAGDILGIEQSGHVAAIGFHLYCKMLQRTIKAIQGDQMPNLIDVKIDTIIDARLPEDYVNEMSLRWEIYQRLGEAILWEDVDLIWEELKDRFGEPPIQTQWLYHLTRLRIFAAANGYPSIKIDAKTLTFEKQKGGETFTKKVFLPVLKTPEEWESKILELLQA
jgi:transcription-repair coupling factor (superfamily II helicase)